MLPQIHNKNNRCRTLKRNNGSYSGTNNAQDQRFLDTSSMEKSSLQPVSPSSWECDYQQQCEIFSNDEYVNCQRSKSIAITKHGLSKEVVAPTENNERRLCLDTASSSFPDVTDATETETVKFKSSDLHDIYNLATWRMYDRIMDYRSKNHIGSSLLEVSNESKSSIVQGKYDVNQNKKDDETNSPNCLFRQCFMDISYGKSELEVHTITEEGTYYGDEIFDLDL
jgi:hypothetical protein